MLKQHIGFHACSQQGGYEGVVEGIPFFAPESEQRSQWLSPGYYFWTDSPTYAKSWKPQGHGRAIGKFTIELNISDEAEELLDLVGNVAHQEAFCELVEMVIEELPEKNAQNIMVNEVISYLRQDKEVFPFIAIKAMDNRNPKNPKNPMQTVKFAHDTNLRLPLVTPQQLCLFDRSRAKLVDFYEPDHYQEQFIKENK
ncbi:hypothetical protein ACEWBT_14090 [Vibrio parahaemolyticus]|nr:MULTISPECIES: hypothetical protein [Vibrio harveyi group]EGQ7873533.1 hypothetical protein [Vibrio parahaemolyticus]EGQ9714858.1 hypothetical protein [Vibrio alginolyticus]EHK7404739.1 hypothetical protein [Vibrio parahaemolyticus]EKQ5901665.1 hypothetical protein [Vibrio parahaemolyticus]ELA8135945.1 hypothetical protein [Vibrio parahaemolyticus]